MAIPGETLGHYELLGSIGAGGMGEVYAAHDPRLGRRVAIKTLPPRLATDRDTLTRFTQEARSASALNHPNIVTIHEVGTAAGTPFIVMECVDGADLRSIMSTGPVAIRKVLDIACQIADGLAAAHERGIVHRDLKPENIMVTSEGFVKILDFGLAKITAPSAGSPHDALQLDVPGTNPGTILGTIGYMSPEQAMGRPIDFRSDQFALGAIIYELIAGRPPFEGSNAIDTLSSILHKDPEPITRVNPRTPAELAQIMRHLLAKSAADRYRSSRDVARDLRAVRDRVMAEESGFHPRRRAMVGRKGIIAAIALGVAILGGAAAIVMRDRPVASAITETVAPRTPQTKYLAVMRFQDLSGDETNQAVVDGFAETLTARLAHYPNVQVMRPPAAGAAADPRQAATNLGANLVLTGSMMRTADRIRITWNVIEPRSGREWRDIVEGSFSDLFAVQDGVAESVARGLELGPSSVRVTRDPAVSQERYLQAIGYLRRYDSDASIDKAIAILEQLGASPTVQAALASAYLHKFQNTRAPQYAAIAGRAAERALESDPQSIEVNITMGELQRQTGRYPESMQSFMRVLSQQPNHADAVLGLAETYKAAGDARNAEASYKRAIALQPNYWGGYNKLGAFYYVQGRYADAIPLFQKVTQLVPDNERGYSNLGSMYQRLGRYEDAVQVFERSTKRTPSGAGFSNLGTCYYFAGRYADAARAFEKATALAPEDYLYWKNLGDACRWIPGHETQARRAFERAIALSDEAIRTNASDAVAHVSRASALAKLGRNREARAAILRTLELEPRDPSYLYEAAVIANIAGARDESLARLEQAVRLGFNADDVRRDPEFSNLLKDGRLRDIVASR